MHVARAAGHIRSLPLVLGIVVTASEGTVSVTIDGLTIEVPANATILDATARAEVYVPTLCFHPDLAGMPWPQSVESVHQGRVTRYGPPGVGGPGCGLCVVEVEGRADLATACHARVAPGMVVQTGTERVRAERQAAFSAILASHPHACLSCPERKGCTRETCPTSVPPAERCCALLGRCAIEELHDYLAPEASSLPTFVRDEALTAQSALFAQDWSLCVACLRCVRACAGIRGAGALGFVLDEGVARLGFAGVTPGDAGCRFCGACVEVCPTGAILDRELHGDDRERTLVPCRAACPVGLDVPAYVRAVAAGWPGYAAHIVREGAPFGRSLGRICQAPCADACRRTRLEGEPIATCALERFACDTAPSEPARRAPPTGRRVAVVGGGPAGLGGARWLVRRGHASTVFEARERAGGLLRWGIPSFRLPHDVVQSEIDEIVAEGVEIRTSTRIDGVAALRKDYDAVLVATGLGRGKRLPVPGADLPCVHRGLEVLEAAAAERAAPLGERVVIIGGGNVAVDCALTARRLGAKAVILACLESEHEMPAFAGELRRARAQGVEILCGWGPVRFAPRGEGADVELRRCISTFEGGRFAPRFDDQVHSSMPADAVVIAIGREPADAPIVADPEDGLFVAGDLAGGEMSVVAAIASGQDVAAAIDRFLGGDGVDRREDRGADAPPAAVPLGAGADGEEPTLSADQAILAASHCLRCDLRFSLGPAPRPPRGRR